MTSDLNDATVYLRVLTVDRITRLFVRRPLALFRQYAEYSCTYQCKGVYIQVLLWRLERHFLCETIGPL